MHVNIYKMLYSCVVESTYFLRNFVVEGNSVFFFFLNNVGVILLGRMEISRSVWIYSIISSGREVNNRRTQTELQIRHIVPIFSLTFDNFRIPTASLSVYYICYCRSLLSLSLLLSFVTWTQKIEYYTRETIKHDKTEKILLATSPFVCQHANFRRAKTRIKTGGRRRSSRLENVW